MHQTVSCQHCKKDFTIEPEDFLFYEKMSVPAPTFCPTCRFVRRLTFMNIRSLYKHKCDLCGENTLSIFNPDSGRTVYCQKCWWSDQWDPSTYGVDYDPSRPFLQQLAELNQRMPHSALESQYATLVNTHYANYTAYSKNCYLVFFADYAENSMYSYLIAHVKDSSDCYNLSESELCYGDIGCQKCYRTFFSEDCSDCNEVWFSKNLTGCSNCIGCKNLRKKQYCIFNEQYTKEEYQEIIKNLKLDSHEGLAALKTKAHDFWMTQPEKYMHVDPASVNVTGEYITQSKNAHHCYAVTGLENARYVQMVTLGPVKDTMDYTCWGSNASLVYDCAVVGENAQNIKFSNECWPNVSELEYCIYAHSSKNMFGCSNIKNQEYCILNKKYSKEEFYTLREQIIADMNSNPYTDTLGRSYPYGQGLTVSLFAYNETEAQLYFPLTKEEALAQGFTWYDKVDNTYQVTISGTDLPATIAEVDDSILDQIISCEKTGRGYRIVRDELDLLRKLNLPLPRRHPDVRFEERHHQVNPPVFYNRTTADGKEVLTAYAPDSPYEILSEEGYQDQVL